MTLEDRERVAHLYKTMSRNNSLAWFGGLWLGAEVVMADRYFRSMATGWRFLSLIGIASVFKGLAMSWSSGLYQPTLGAYFRKYQSAIQRDLWDIKDKKKEYFYIDTSQYMNYTNESIGDGVHCHHGPQPVSIFIPLSILTLSISYLGRRITRELLLKRSRQIPQRRGQQP